MRRAVIAVLALCAVAARASAKLPAGAPREAAVIALGDDGERLYVADLASRRLRAVSAAGETPHQPSWSPDGKYLAYRVDTRLLLHQEGQAADRGVSSAVEIDTNRACAFSPDGQSVAVAETSAVALVALDGARERRTIALTGRRVGDLMWSPGGETLVVLARVAPANAVELVRVDAASGSTKARPAPAVSRLLGWRGGGELLVVTAAESGERVAAISDGGPAPLADQPREQFVVERAGDDRFVWAAGGEDPGDDAILSLSRPGSPPVRWLRRHPKLADLRVDASGRWALFVDRATGGGRGGGSVWLVRVGAERATLVLPADGARTFLQPTPRPPPR